ncbi:hypothetical protein Hypma_012286 [Hypsizygus marmoreus]|uniref:Uncharacterized protein n=1 Tax=Hypsizygus marmoreus TaxID=39966 RepID=A0A369JLR6_HYPMA|nr:hypothetical protein Hypma_012286 [Hypsizygus marmoreus]
MLLDDNPRFYIKAIPFHDKHNNIIVELPGEVDAKPILGAHYHSRFLLPPYKSFMAGVSYIYEYNYKRHGDPSKKDWSIIFPPHQVQYEHDLFKSPYPSPSPAPHPRYISYAVGLPPHLTLKDEGALEQRSTRNATSLVDGHPTETFAAVHSDDGKKLEMLTNLSHHSYKPPFKPYSLLKAQPTHAQNTKIDDKNGKKARSMVKKEDSYDEALQTERVLRNSDSGRGEQNDINSNSVDHAYSYIAPVKGEDPMIEVPVKTEASNGPYREAYEPSEDLMAAFKTLPHHYNLSLVAQPGEETKSNRLVKQEPSHSFTPPHITDTKDIYRPSTDLLAAFASLPHDLFYPEAKIEAPTNRFVKQEGNVYLQVKEEVIDGETLQLGMHSHR